MKGVAAFVCLAYCFSRNLYCCSSCSSADSAALALFTCLAFQGSFITLEPVLADVGLATKLIDLPLGLSFATSGEAIPELEFLPNTLFSCIAVCRLRVRSIGEHKEAQTSRMESS